MKELIMATQVAQMYDAPHMCSLWASVIMAKYNRENIKDIIKSSTVANILSLTE